MLLVTVFVALPYCKVIIKKSNSLVWEQVCDYDIMFGLSS